MTQLGENGDVTPEVAREIFNACLIIKGINSVNLYDMGEWGAPYK